MEHVAHLSGARAVCRDETHIVFAQAPMGYVSFVPRTCTSIRSLSRHEQRTARCVDGELQKYGFTVQTGIGGTGVTGILADGAGPTVLLRAELDALPIRENTGVDYASTVTTKAADGHEVPVAHACGHDMHMSCLLGMAELLHGRSSRPVERNPAPAVSARRGDR